MSAIEKIEKYIENTGKISGSYSMRMCETYEMIRMASETPVEALLLAFQYGQAKGYRAAKAEVRKK